MVVDDASNEMKKRLMAEIVPFRDTKWCVFFADVLDRASNDRLGTETENHTLCAEDGYAFLSGWMY